MIGHHVHFIGIGGYGMSGLAAILLGMGHAVSGSDVHPSTRTDRLAALGATVHLEHSPAHLAGADTVVYSTDVPEDNPELAAARAAGLPVWHRSELLAELLNARQGVAVTGTHGKTTTTAMIGCILERGGLDPTVVVGGEVPSFGGNARLGRGPHFVAEADESDGSFLRYRPRVAVVTNLEPEHLDHYGGDFRRVVAAVERFLEALGPEGLAILGRDDPRLAKLGGRAPCRVQSYGLSGRADWTALRVRREGGETVFVVRAGGAVRGEVRLRIPGRHNVHNALAALAVGNALGVPFPVAAAALREFPGAKRRFEVRAHAGGITVVDDYAHHPTEIRATLQAAREQEPGRLIAVFQPQRYVRTKLLFAEFSRAFAAADRVLVVDIYSPPGEVPIPGVNSQALAAAVAREGVAAEYAGSVSQVLQRLRQLVRPGDLVLTMGAGDVWKVAEELAATLGSEPTVGVG
ncbi:MAG: UDP-N-acetylmuramate--L-alanine ligase [Thermaerobacter sp.]|nr:UDP-N-acetylmuramate--L-alanine ligase [Thermaerobacter sp.]